MTLPLSCIVERVGSGLVVVEIVGDLFWVVPEGGHCRSE